MVPHYHCNCGAYIKDGVYRCRVCKRVTKCSRCKKQVSLSPTEKLCLCNSCKRNKPFINNKKVVNKNKDYKHIAKEKRRMINQQIQLQSFGNYILEKDLSDEATELILYLISICTCSSWAGIVPITLLFLKSKISNNTIKEKLIEVIHTNIEIPDLQSKETVEMPESLPDISTNMSKYTELPFVKAILRIYTFVVGFFFYGTDVFKKNLDIELKSTKVYEMLSGVDLISTLVSSIKFVITRVGIFLKTGKWTVFLHSGSAYEQWQNDVDSNALLMERLNSYDTTIDRQTFIKATEKLISQGEEIRDVMKASGSPRKELNIVVVNLLQLQRRFNSLKVNNFANNNKELPYGIILGGASSIGKSSLTRILHAHFTAVRGRPISFDTIYSRTATAEFWDEFRSFKTTIVIDDAVCHEPGHVQGIDNTVNEVLNIINPVGFTPNMAALDDKGKHPLLADLVLVTTNDMDLGSRIYFKSPYAVQRRFRLRLKIEVKPEFAHNQSLIAKDYDGGDYPDWWNITVQYVKPVAGTRGTHSQQYIIDKEVVYTNMHSFLNFMTGDIQSHFGVQDKMLQLDNQLVDMKRCQKCFLPKCNCAELQSFSTHFNTPQFLFGYTLYALYRNFQNIQTSKERLRYDLLVCFNTFMYAVFGFFTWQFIIISSIASSAYWFSTQAYGTQRAIMFFCKYFIQRCLNYETLAWQQMRDIGERLEILCNITPEMKWILGLIATGVFILFIKRQFQNEDATELQGFSTVAPKSKCEPESVYKKKDYVCTIFDIPRITLSLKDQSIEHVNSVLGKSLVSLTFWIQLPDGRIWKATSGGFLLGGNKVLTTSHGFRAALEGNKEIAVIIAFDDDMTLHSIMQTSICVDDVKFDYELALITFKEMTPRKKITTWFSNESLTSLVSPAFLLVRREGKLTRIDVTHSKYGESLSVNGVDLEKSKLWKFNTTSTINGDCGGIWFSNTPTGPIPIAMHVAMTNTHTLGIMLSKKRIDNLTNDMLIMDNLELFPIPHDAKIGNLVSKHKFAGTNYIDFGKGYIESYGSLDGFRTESRSDLQLTPAAKWLESNYSIPVKVAPAVLKGWKVKKNHLDQFVQHNVGSARLISLIVSQMAKEWKDMLGDKIKDLKTYSLETAINGVPGLRYVDRLDLSTSAGAYYKCPKKNLVHFEDDDFSKPFVLREDVLERVELLLDKYKNLEMGNTLFTASLKDEVRKHSKVDSCNTRIFMGGPIELTVATRMLFSAFARLFYMEREIFESAVGIDAMSHEWHDMVTRTSKGRTKYIAGDYSHYDTTFMCRIYTELMEAIIELYIDGGFIKRNDDNHKAMYACSQDLIFFLTDYFGEIVRVRGKNASGQPLTVIINSLHNSVLNRLGWVLGHPNFSMCKNDDDIIKIIAEFRTKVTLVTYGDDDWKSIDDNADWFTHTSLAQSLSVFGIIYTTADKSDKKVDFITLKEIEFLKRKFTYSIDLQQYVAPLHLDSIYKNLQYRHTRSILSFEQHMANKIIETNNNFFLHGKEVFETWRSRLRDLIDFLCLHEYVTDDDLKTYEQLKNKYLLTTHESV